LEDAIHLNPLIHFIGGKVPAEGHNQ